MIYINSDTIFHFNPGLSESITGAYVNNAVVSGQLKTSSGQSLYSFEFDFLEGSQGDYVGTIPQSVGATLTCGTEYIVDVTIEWNESTGGDRRYEIAGVRTTQ